MEPELQISVLCLLNLPDEILVYIFSYLGWFDRMALKVVCHRFLNLLGVASYFRRDRHLELERCTFSTSLPPLATFTNCYQDFHSLTIGSICMAEDVSPAELQDFWVRVGRAAVKVDAGNMILEREGSSSGTDLLFYESFCNSLALFSRLKKLSVHYELAVCFINGQIQLASIQELEIFGLNGDLALFESFMALFPKVKTIRIVSIDDFEDDFLALLRKFGSKIKSLDRDVFRERYSNSLGGYWRIEPLQLLSVRDLQLDALDCKRVSLDIRRFINTQKRLKELTAAVASFPIPAVPITHLNLSHIPIGLLDPCLQQYTSLQSLTYTAQNYDSEAMKLIFKHQHQLTELNLYDFHHRQCFLGEWQPMPRLERLGLFSVAQVTVKGIRHLCRMAPKLNSLRLLGQFRGDPNRIVETIVSELRDLQVFEIALHEAGATSLTFDHIARHGKRLKMLGLGENEVEVLSSAKKFWLFKQLPMLREVRDFGSAYSKTRRTDYLIFTAQSDE